MKNAFGGNNRDRKTSSARQTAMFLCRSLMPMTLTDIGTEFGNRDHTTVMTAIKKAETMQKSNKEYSEAVQNIRLNLTMT